MTPLNALYVCLAVIVVAVGGGLLLLLWQVAVLLATLKSSILPQLQGILTETQKTLVKVDDITRNVDGKLHKLDLTVDDAQTTVHAVAEATKFFSDGVAKPAMVNLLAVGVGARAAWQRYREMRARGRSGEAALRARPVDERKLASSRARATELVTPGSDPDYSE